MIKQGKNLKLRFSVKNDGLLKEMAIKYLASKGLGKHMMDRMLNKPLWG